MCKTDRFKNSPIPFFIRLLNMHTQEKIPVESHWVPLDFLMGPNGTHLDKMGLNGNPLVSMGRIAVEFAFQLSPIESHCNF